MSINYTLVSIIMLFVILISIQFTLNKIFMILKESRDILLNKKIKDDYNEGTRKYESYILKKLSRLRTTIY